MWNPQISMSTILAAAERGELLTVSETELRERLDALIERMPLRSEHERGEHRLICAALNRIQVEMR